MIYQIGMVITTKKPHVCGNNHWEVMRLGIDIGIKCLGCGRQLMMLRNELDKKIKQPNLRKD